MVLKSFPVQYLSGSMQQCSSKKTKMNPIKAKTKINPFGLLKNQSGFLNPVSLQDRETLSKTLTWTSCVHRRDCHEERLSFLQ